MIEVSTIGSNYFSLRGDCLERYPDSSVSIHTIVCPGVRGSDEESYEWEITLNVSGSGGRPFPLYRDVLPRSAGRLGVGRKLMALFADYGIAEELALAEVMEYCERLHKRWMRGEIGLRDRPHRPDEDSVADVLAEPAVRWDLVAHLKEQIEKDPLAYANDAKVRACLGKIVADLNHTKAMDEIDHGNHHSREQDDCPCYDCRVRRVERRP